MINPKAFLTFTLLALCLALPVHAKPHEVNGARTLTTNRYNALYSGRVR